MKKLTLFLFLLFFTLIVLSQEGYVNGYVINYKGDTIQGKIKDRKYSNGFVSWQKINFMNSKTGENEKLTADELKGYVKSDSLIYTSLTLGIEEKKRFVAILESGAIILYADIKNSATPDAQKNTNAFGGKALLVTVRMAGSTQSTQGEYYLQKKNDVNSLMEWRDRDYKATAAYFFKDDKELVKSISSDAFGYSDLQNIVKKYNNWKAQQ